MNRNIFLGIVIYGMCVVNGFAQSTTDCCELGPKDCAEYYQRCNDDSCSYDNEAIDCNDPYNGDDEACKMVILEIRGDGNVLKKATKGTKNDLMAKECTIVKLGVTPNPGFKFVGWTSSNQKYPDFCKNAADKENGEEMNISESSITCTAQFDEVEVIEEVPAPISSTEPTSPGTASTTNNTTSPAGTTATTTTTSETAPSGGSAVTSGMTNTPTGPAATTTIPPSGTASNNSAVAPGMAGTIATGSVATTTAAPSGSTTSSGPTVTSGTAGTTQGTTVTGNTQPTSAETVKDTSASTASTTGGPDSGTNASSAVSTVGSSDSGKGSTPATANSTLTPTNGDTATGSSNGAMVSNTSSTTTSSVTETPNANTTKPSTTDSSTGGATTTTVSPTTSTPATVEGSTNHSPNAPGAGSNAGNTAVTTTSPPSSFPNTGGSNENKNDNQPGSTATTTTTGEDVTPGSSTVNNGQPSGNNEVDSTYPQGGTAETFYGNGDFISGQPFYPGATVDPAYYEGMNSEYVAGSGQSPAAVAETQPVSYNNASSTWSSPYANDYADHWAKANPSRPTTLDLGIDPKQWTLKLYPSRNSQLVDNKDGTLTYTANSGFKGVDTFSYSMADSSGQISVYIVKIQVSADYTGYDYWDFTKDTSGSDYSGNHGNTIYNAWPPATACDLIYAVNDQGVSDSQLLYIDPNQKTTQAFGPILKGYDIEGLEISPYNNRLYAVSSGSAPKDRRGQLYAVDPNNAELTVIGKTGFDDINALAFRYDGTLWGWAAGKGIVQIDPETARSYVRVPFKRINAEGLAWTSDGKYLYASEGADLWWWHYGDASEVSKKCQNLPGEVEALETLGSGMLMFAIDQDDGHKIYVYDPWDCKIVMDRSFVSNYSDIESFAWSTKCEPQPAQLPALENWSGEFNDSAKLNDSECRTKPGWITVEGKVSLTPATSQAFIRSNWQVVNLSSDESVPAVEDGQPACPGAPSPLDIDCVSPHYNSEIISDSFNFKVMAWWPGKPSKANVDMDTVLGTYVSIDILDLKGNSIAETSKLSRTLWWIESLCDGSKGKPAKTPKATKIEVVEPENVNIDSREEKDNPFTNEPLESSKGGAGAAETKVAVEVVGEDSKGSKDSKESKESKESAATGKNTDKSAKDNAKPAKVNSDKLSTTAKDKAAKDQAAKDKVAKDKAAKETKKDQPAAPVKEDKADQATVNDKSPADKEDKVNSDKVDNSAKGDSSNKEDNSAKADNKADDSAKAEKDSAEATKTDNGAKADNADNNADKVDKTDKIDNTEKTDNGAKADNADNNADKVDKTDKIDNTDKVEKADKVDKADSDSAKSNEKASSSDESTDKITEVDKAKEDKSATDKSKSDSADKRDEGKN